MRRYQEGEEIAAERDRPARFKSSSQPSLEMPTARDPALWMVKCKPGMENEAAIQLMRRFFEYQARGTPLQIYSVISNPVPTSMGKAFIYVEAFKEMHVQEAGTSIKPKKEEEEQRKKILGKK